MSHKVRWTLVLVLGCSMIAPTVGMAAIKCWTNKDGVRECGNVVPPEYSQQETRTLNDRGVTVNIKARAKTPEEIEADKEKQAEAQKQAADEKRKREEAAAYDQMLLATFTTEQDLLASRDRKLGAIDATIEITRVTISNLQRKLNDLKAKAAQQERSGRPISDDLKEDMAAVDKQIKEKQDYVDYSQHEKETLRAKYDADLKRYRELTSVKPK